MRALSVSALLLLALNSCRGTQDNLLDEDVIEPVVQASKYGSLWPLPQKVQISEVPLKLSGATFAFTDAKGSTAGPSCSLLQSAYRRWDTAFAAARWLFNTPGLVIRGAGAVVRSRTGFPLSAGTMIIFLGALKNRRWAETDELAPWNWQSCKCRSHHLTPNVMVILLWRQMSHVSPPLPVIMF